jgi:alpha-beta hydrolase superfamily lysophospholipase
VPVFGRSWCNTFTPDAIARVQFIHLQEHVMQIQILRSGTAQLATRVYAPSSPARASVVIGGAMGVRQDYYAPFAQWLSLQGFCVTTFDYRGSGESLPNTASGSLRGFKADLLDWAADYEAVVDAAKAALPDAPLYLLGHSLGAQLPGFLNNQDKIDGLVSIAAGSGYWRDNAPQLRRLILYFWYVLWLFPRAQAQKSRRPASRRDAAVAQVVPGSALQRGGRGRKRAAELWAGQFSGDCAVHDRRRADDLARHAKPHQPVQQCAAQL